LTVPETYVKSHLVYTSIGGWRSGRMCGCVQEKEVFHHQRRQSLGCGMNGSWRWWGEILYPIVQRNMRWEHFPIWWLQKSKDLCTIRGWYPQSCATCTRLLNV